MTLIMEIWCSFRIIHYSDVIMCAMASQITGVSIICSFVCSGTDQRKHQNFASLAFVRGIHRWPVDSPHKAPLTRKMFPFDDVIMSHGFRGHIKAKPHGCCIFFMILHEAPSMETTTPKGEWFPCWVAEWSRPLSWKICNNKCGFVFIPRLYP